MNVLLVGKLDSNRTITQEVYVNGAGKILTSSTSTSDPTVSVDNVATVYNRSDNVTATTIAVSQVFSSGTFHYNINKNAAGQVTSISAWGSGASGAVGGY